MEPEVAAAGLGILWEAIGRDITNKLKAFFGQPIIGASAP